MATIKLESLDREKRPEPFSIELTDGTEVFFADPKGMHWKTVVELDDMEPMTRLKTLTGNGFDALVAEPYLDGDALNKVMAAWRDHYGVGESGEAGSSSGS